MITSHPFPRFILRENLGKLARDLRLLGYDAAVYQNIGFHNLNRIAARDKRIILTRSHLEANRKKLNQVLLIQSDNNDEQLREISSILEFNENYIFSRCSLCNKLLYEIDKEKILNLVPEFVISQNSSFRICRFCGHIYWRGDHYQAMIKRLKNLFEDVKV